MQVSLVVEQRMRQTSPDSGGGGAVVLVPGGGGTPVGGGGGGDWAWVVEVITNTRRIAITNIA
ncbi:hypothetical protein QJS10_CPA05g00495 [Acorus calamus]|uniref:Uncharacterized protein n=1 Tax=Acorus calamus TaxID=4465 RepID=A0AAV9ES30_ACOCL|nr:hypothetical protein QJS10_CPA05g00495 [Acorus calamus]